MEVLMLLLTRSTRMMHVMRVTVTCTRRTVLSRTALVKHECDSRPDSQHDKDFHWPLLGPIRLRVYSFWHVHTDMYVCAATLKLTEFVTTAHLMTDSQLSRLKVSHISITLHLSQVLRGVDQGSPKTQSHEFVTLCQRCFLRSRP